jgi:DNA-binding NtrC family response regulator
MNKSPRLLIVDDETRILSILSKLFEEGGYEVVTSSDPEAAVATAAELHPHVALVDLAMPGIDGIELLSRLKGDNPRLQVVIMTAYGSISSAVEAMRRGAFDYITKPFDNDELLLVIERALGVARLEARVKHLETQLEARFRPENIVGTSGAMVDVFQRIDKVAPLDTTVLIQGESGTGKELVARAIHRHSSRKDGPFVAINCGAIPPNLVESEFFGHERGAFTDARDRRRGRFEMASGGTLFLDEVGELSPAAQVGLLRVLEEGEFVRVGGEQPIACDVRVIAASNRDLAEAVEKGEFRDDLFWRLNVVAFQLPALRDRPEDIPLLIDHFLHKYSDEIGRGIEGIDATALSLLVAHRWPGNVRELENTIEHAVALASASLIKAEDLPMRLRAGGGEADAATEHGSGGGGEGTGGDLQGAVTRAQEAVERRMIIQALERTGGNRTEAARRLGVSRKTLFNKIRTLGIDAADPD